MVDKTFAQWFLTRVQPFRDVPPEKLAAEREAMSKQQEFNNHYAEFLNTAVFPAVESLVQLLAKSGIVHRVSTWGNQLSPRRSPSVIMWCSNVTQSWCDCMITNSPHRHAR